MAYRHYHLYTAVQYESVVPVSYVCIMAIHLKTQIVQELSIDFGKHLGSNTAIFSSLVGPVLDMCIKSAAVGDI